jgi:hypothetical protein
MSHIHEDTLARRIRAHAERHERHWVAAIWVAIRVLRALMYVSLFFAGVFALLQPSATQDLYPVIVASMLDWFLVVGGLAAAVGWVTGFWVAEEVGAILLASGLVIYLIGFIPLALMDWHRGLTVALFLALTVACVLRVLEIRRFTSLPPRG